jgi:hypothetical protein
MNHKHMTLSLIAILATLHLFDILSTEYAISIGLVEANPIVRTLGLPVSGLVAGLSIVIFLLARERVFKRSFLHVQILYAGLLPAVFVGGVVLVNNIIVLGSA